MTNIKYTEKASSFFNGPKTYAKYTGAYIDIYNVLQKTSGEHPVLTPGKHYKILSAGDAYNPLNAFRNYFPMILIKDDRGYVFGFDEELFDMSDEYASDQEIYDRTHKSDELFSQSPDFTSESTPPTREEEDDEEYEEDYFETPCEVSHDLFYENLEKLKADFEFCIPCNAKNLDEVEKMLKTYADSKIAVLYKNIQTYYVYRLEKNLLYSGNQLILRDYDHQKYMKGETEAYFLYSKPKKAVKIVEAKTIPPTQTPNGRFKDFAELKHFIESNATNSQCPFVYEFNQMDRGSYKELLNKINEDSGIFIGYQTLGVLLTKKDKKISGYNCRTLKKEESTDLIEFNIEAWQDHPEFIVRVVSYAELNLQGLKQIKK